MAEWLKALVLKTCVSNFGTVGSNPTPSAWSLQIWGGARVVEWGRLLSGFPGYTGTQVRILSLPHSRESAYKALFSCVTMFEFCPHVGEMIKS